MEDIKLVLGDFVFQDMELPESIPFPGDQQLAVKKFVGGKRDIQALGKDFGAIEWSGVFFQTNNGQSALDRVRNIEQMRDKGLPVPLYWDELYFSVYIRRFDPEYRFGRIPYRISLEVLEDKTAPLPADFNPNADDLINADMNAAGNLSDGIGNSLLSQAVAAVRLAVGSVSTFVGATSGAVASVLGPINSARNVIGNLTASNERTLSSATAPGGVVVGASTADNVAAFSSQLSATNQQVSLLRLNSLLGRMSINLAQINSSGRTVTVSGGNLYDIAAKQYGDPSAWTQIAQANGLSDPVVNGVTTLIIPPYNNGKSGGILGA